MAKGDVLVRMKADVSNYDANIAKARRTLDGFKQDNLTLGGILNQSTKSIVAAAAQYASFAAIIGTVASGFANAVSKGKEMSREAEGVSMAFERLNQPGLLDNLREATHNTVNDLELMKQAVKFDNFNLSLKQMGTFLAFAQQQAKDTGQDVNTLVDSIVLGLGRKSLPILDNLGLSAEEIRERMKETGDMTKAVAEIIEERMAAAGEYVETASERAAQAQTRLDNAMKALGDTMNSLSGSGAALWSELEIGAVKLANTAIKPLISLFNQLASYVQGTSVEDILTRGMTDVTDTVDDNGRLIRKNAIASIPEITVIGTAHKKTRGSGGGGNTKTEPTYAPDSIEAQQALVQQLTKQWNEAGASVRDQYIQPLVEAEAKLKEMKNEQALLKEQAQGRLNGVNLWQGDIDDIAGGPGKRPQFVGGIPEIGKGLETLPQHLSPLQEMNAELSRMKELLEMAPNTDAYQAQLQKIVDKEKEIAKFKGATDTEDTAKNSADAWRGAAAAMSSVGSALSQMEDPGAKIMGIIGEAIANIASGFAQASAQEGKGGVWYWIAATAAGLATMVTTIATIHSATGFAQGGIVQGTTNSGDQIPIRANAGEVVLTRAMAGNLASQLEGNGLGNLNLSATISGEQIRLALNNNGRRTGRGEYVQTNFR